MRDIWQNGAKGALATYPKRLKSSGIKRLIEHALWEQGIRLPLPKGEKRHEWKAAHGLRKYFKSKAEQGHSIGISASYYRPLEREVLEDYLKAISLLTIGGGEYQQQIENKHQDEEIQTLKQEVSRLTSLVETISQNFLLKLPTQSEKQLMD